MLQEERGEIIVFLLLVTYVVGNHLIKRTLDSQAMCGTAMAAGRSEESDKAKNLILMSPLQRMTVDVRVKHGRVMRLS